MEVKSVAKCLKALDYILESALTQTDCGLSDIAAHLGEQSSTMRNILKTMEESGYVGRNGSKYLPGAHCNGMNRIARIAEIELNDWINRLNSMESLRNESLVIATIVNGKRIVLYRREGGTPRLIVEYKAPDIPISERVFNQISAYNSVLRADYLIVSNGVEHYCCHLDYVHRTAEFLPGIPRHA